MHRDYAQPGGHVAIAVFDDRVEIRSPGALPAGITADQLSGPHPSVLRNPLIAETFHRTGAVEVWGRGTNRVIEECRRYGVDEPTFEEQGGTVVVTFRRAYPTRGRGDGEPAGTGSPAGDRRQSPSSALPGGDVRWEVPPESFGRRWPPSMPTLPFP